MKKVLLIALVLISCWNFNFAHNGDTTCTENCKEITLNHFIGEWAFTKMAYQVADKVHYCNDFIIADEAFLKFQFDENGNYIKTFGNDTDETTENGTWEVSEDGYNLVLFPVGAGAAQFIKIKKMDDEKVVLELDIDSAGLSDLFCSEINVLNFSKSMLPLSNSILR